jgi:DNA polymerase-3 subunit alpha
MKNIIEKINNDSKYLSAINEKRLLKTYEDKNVIGSISKWEMDSLSFYYHEHELINIDFDAYSIKDFYSLGDSPNVVEYYKFRGQDKPRFELVRICGTVLDKDKHKHIITVLTPTGVVKVKFYKGQFVFYDKQISRINEDGSKTVLEKSWFTRGNKVLITGYRREDQFIPKKYNDSVFKHSIQLIKEVNGDRLKLQNERVGVEQL